MTVVAVLLAALAAPVWSESIAVPDSSFEEDGRQGGWRLSGGKGRRIDNGSSGGKSVSVAGGIAFRAEAHISVPELDSPGSGMLLPASSGAAGLWWAPSGSKIGRMRQMPESRSDAVVIRAAGNETEAVQVVIWPKSGLKGLVATPGMLKGPSDAAIPAGRVQVLRVRYVEVSRPSDGTGCAGPWPDPLPPLRGPIDLEPGMNHPFWVRVSVPRGTPAGEYSGVIRFHAGEWEAGVTLRVEVFGFSLPDRMTCTTAFGFDPRNVWRYQRLGTEEQRREVLEKYWDDFSAHHISPYDPAPLDPIEVTWPGVVEWEGGVRSGEAPYAGKSCLLVEDSSITEQAGAFFKRRIGIPPSGLRLKFRHRAARGHRFIVTFGHCDGSGAWMPGRNNDMAVEGTGGWAEFDREVKAFPPGAKSVRLTLWAAEWKDDGSPVGSVRYDDLSVSEAESGKALLSADFEPLGPEALVPAFDWSRWDAQIAKAVDARHFNSFMLHVEGMGGGTFHSRVPPSLLGFGEETAEYKTAFRNYCRILEEHLADRGWLDEAFVYWFDEPEPKDYPFVMNGFRKLREAAPRIRRMLTEQPEDGLIGGPDIWCPCTPAYDHEKAKLRRAAGESFWWYVCTGPKAPYCGLFIDHPATDLRAWLWQTWERRIDGVLVWQTNYWTSDAAYPDPAKPQNPYEDPMGWTSGYSTPSGRRIPWGNGDGRFIYPPEEAADANPSAPVLDGPVDSIRWEMLRDGIEDYEYLAILRRLLVSRKDSLAPEEFRRIGSLLGVPASITRSMTEYTRDPAPIEERRIEIARAIEALAGGKR